MAGTEPPDQLGKVIPMDGFRKFQKELGDTRLSPGPDTGQLVDRQTYFVARKALEFLGEFRPGVDEAPVITKREPSNQARLFHHRGNPSVFVVDPSRETLEFLGECAEVYHPEDPSLPDKLERFYTSSLIVGSLITAAGAIDDKKITSPVLSGDEVVNVADDPDRCSSVNSWRAGSGVSHLVMRSFSGGSSDIKGSLHEGVENSVIHARAEANFARVWGRTLPDENDPVSDEVLGLANPLDGLELHRVIFTYRGLTHPED